MFRPLVFILIMIIKKRLFSVVNLFIKMTSEFSLEYYWNLTLMSANARASKCELYEM